MPKEFSELLDAYLDQEKLYRSEGRQGVKMLCQVANAIGYKDPMYFGQLSSKAAIGDLICMLEDNSGMVEAMIDWLRDRNVDDWTEALKSQVPEEDEDELSDAELDDGDDERDER